MISEVTPEVLADIQTPRDVRISPDGKHVVYAVRSFWVRQKEHITASLWMAEVGEENSSRQLTQGNFHDLSPTFSPDGKHIAFLSDRAKQGKAAALHLLPVNGGEALPLTSTNNEKGVVEYNWSPDGKSIAFLSSDERTDDRKKKDEAKDDAKVYGEDWEFNRLRLISVDEKKVITLFEDREQVGALTWSPNGKEIAFVTYKTPELNALLGGEANIKILDVETQESRVKCRVLGPVQHLIWAASRLLWLGQHDPESVCTAFCVYSVSADNKAADAYSLAYGDNECAVRIRLCGDKVIAHTMEGLSDQLRILSSKPLFSEETSISQGWDGLIKGNKTTLVITKGSTGVYEEVFSVVDGKCTQLSQHNKEFTELKIGTGKALKCKAEDGLELDGAIFTPTSLAGKRGPHPTVVIIHGGPYHRQSVGEDPNFHWLEWMLSLGYVVIVPNYRGSSSRGAKFAEKVRGNIDASHADVICLIKQGIKDGVVDEKRVAVTGWSQGGYLSFLSATRPSAFKFACVIAGAGVTHWDTMAMTSDIPTFERALSGSAPWDGKQDANFKANPIFGVKDVQCPMLILHGEEDARVPKEQSIGFHRGMMAYGKECQLVMYPREGHGFPIPFERAHHIDMLKRIRDFLRKHLA